jgi:hypothetical protein
MFEHDDVKIILKGGGENTKACVLAAQEANNKHVHSDNNNSNGKKISFIYEELSLDVDEEALQDFVGIDGQEDEDDDTIQI